MQGRTPLAAAVEQGKGHAALLLQTLGTKTIGFVLRPSFLSGDILKTITLPRREHEQQTQGEIFFRKERTRLFMQAPTSITFASTARQEEFRPFFCAQLPFCCTENATILPRQARDKHTSMKSTQKREWARVHQTVLHTVTSSGDLRSENAPQKLFLRNFIIY